MSISLALNDVYKGRDLTDYFTEIHLAKYGMKDSKELDKLDLELVVDIYGSSYSRL